MISAIRVFVECLADHQPMMTYRHILAVGAIQVLCNAVGGGGVCVSFPKKKHYEGVQFNVTSVTRWWVGVKFPGKKRYVTLEWPHTGEYCPRSLH